ncbi:MAG: F0F1 ATP synthase subunit epsilon [Pseudomonadota bacterium]
MAFQFDLVSPERRLASFEATEVQIPGADGDLTAMPDHAATITTLRPGVLKATGAEGQKSFAVTGGFAEITPGGASILAERAMPMSEVTAETVNALIAEARDAASGATGEAKDAADKLVADYEAIKAAL